MRILLFHNLIAVEKAHEILIALRFLAGEKILPAPDKGAELGLIGFGLGKREPLHIEIVLFQRPRHPPPANRFLLRFQAPVRRIGDIVRIQLLRFFIPMDELFDQIDQLDEEVQKIIKLRFFEELSLREIADVVQMNLNTVKAKLYRGLKLLKQNIQEVDL